MAEFLNAYFQWIAKEKVITQLRSSCPCEKEGHFDINTYEEKIISDYCGISLFEVYELNIFEHWFLLMRLFMKNSQTEEGRNI